jgi:hypothetical protein
MSWIIPIYFAEGGSTLLSPTIQMLTCSSNTCTETPLNNVYPVILVSLFLVKIKQSLRVYPFVNMTFIYISLNHI